MIGRDLPATVRQPLDVASAAPDCFEPSHMRFGKALGGSRIVPKMLFDAVNPGISGGYFGNDPVCRTDGRDYRVRARKGYFAPYRPASPK